MAAGAANISSAGSTLTVNQSSGKAIINWSGFSIGQGGVVQFNNGSGATLNRVTGSGVSSIAGLLNATGSVYLINPNGVIVGKTGVVNTGGRFVASTLDLTDSNFLKGGDLTFDGPSTASVVNLGKIGALGGDVALIATTVRNDGDISAPQGDVGLLAGSQVLVRDAALDGGKFAVLVGGAGTSATNSGAIEAAMAELRANGGDVYALAGDTSGVIRATGVSSTDGRVFLIAEGGTAHVAGTIEAQGRSGAPGQIETSGATLDIGAAKVDAHGGTWLLDPTDITIDQTAATSISNALANGNVTENAAGAGSGAGDITVAAPISWGSNFQLTLNAYRNLAINAPITASGGGYADLYYNQNNSGGALTFAQGASLKFTGAEGLGQTLRINGQYYTLLYTLAELDSIDGVSAIDGSAVTPINSGYGSGLGARYALAKPLDASGTTYANALIGSSSSSFSGVLEGLGNSISNLTIAAPNLSDVGLIAQSTGTIRDLGLIGGSVSGHDHVGGLAGLANYPGSVVNSFSTGAVSGQSQVGGLAGENEGTIANSYATGVVGASYGPAGGLVGLNGGPITNAYATGAVASGTLYAGGLVGVNFGGITASYATGAVSSPSYVGGLVGYNPPGGGGGATNAYWDTQTSGQAGSSAGTGQTTAQLQSGTPPSGFSGAAWAAGPGLYPYLKSFYSNGVPKISGNAYTDAGATPMNAGQVTATLNGSALGSASIGANGYYYIYLPTAPGSISGGATLLAYTNGSNPGATLQTITGATAGVDIYGGILRYTTADYYLSAAQADKAAALAAISAPSFVNGLSPFINVTGGYFNVDQPVTGALGVQATTAGASIVVAAPIAVGANALTLQSAGGLTINAPITLNGGKATLSYGGGGDLTFALGSSVAFLGGSGSGESLSINGNSYSLFYSMAALQGVNTAAGSYSALAQDLTPTTGYGGSVISGGYFGTLEGLGHTITGLNISSSGDFVGLIGSMQSGATLRDIGLIGGSISGRYRVGGLAGFSNGSISNAYDTGAVHGSSFVGGLVGESSGSITNAFATGAVSGSRVGGLVGHTTGGAITNAYATGAVSGVTFATGGLVGYDQGGSITNAYATGAVSGSGTSIGGLVGYNSSGGAANPVTNSYWDTQTTGQSSSAGGTGQTTAQLQRGYLPDGFQAPVWSTGYSSNVYPFLQSFYPNGVQAISGTAYSDAGTKPLGSGATVSLDGGGAQIGQATTGANGYWYIVAPAGTLSGGESLLASTTGGSNSATLASYTGPTGSLSNPQPGVQTGLNLLGGALTGSTSALLWSLAPAPPTKAAALAVAGGDAGAVAAVNGTTGAGLLATGASFTLDQPLTLTAPLSIQLTAAGAPLTVAAPISAGANALGLVASGALAVNATVTLNGGQVSLSYDVNTSSPSPMDLTFAEGSSLAFLGGPGSGETLSVNGNPYTLLYSMSALAGMNTAAGSYSALAHDLTAPATAYGGAVIGSYSGTLEGLGHTITGLTINSQSNAQNIGLFGILSNGSVVRDLGLIGGSIVGYAYVGALAGNQSGGSITNAYATSAINGQDDAGGLVGRSNGSITNAYATGAVSGISSIGGLVGDTSNGASILNAYATGSVNGSINVGGLIGLNSGSVKGVYATGAASGTNQVGGLIGDNNTPGTVANAYWDTQTSGRSNAFGYDNAGQTATGLTTAQFQASGASTLGVAFFGGLGGTYPYLKTFFPNGVQAVSGTAYQSDGTTPLAGAPLTLFSGGGPVGLGASTGTNGYWYAVLPVGTLASLGLKLGVLTCGCGPLAGFYSDALSFSGSAGAQTLSGLNISANVFQANTHATTYSGLIADLGVTFGSTNGLLTLPATIVNATGAGFTLDQPLTLAGALGVATTGPAAPLTVAAPISAAPGGLALTASGALSIAAPVTIAGGPVSLAYGAGLSFTGGRVDFGASGGSLTINSTPYTLIRTATDLAGAGSSGTYALATNADLGGSPLTGAPITSFGGTFEGLGNTISNLTIAAPASSNVGMVGTLAAGGLIRDLTLANVSATGLGYTAALVGDNFGSVLNVSASGTVIGMGGTGGLVGVNEGGASVANASSSASVSGTDNVGGLVGASFGTVANAAASGRVTATGNQVGGLIGFNNSVLTGATASGAVSGNQYVGGLVGLNYAAITGSTATGQASGVQYVGGLAGWNTSYGTLTGDTASGGATATLDYAGGLAGGNAGAIVGGTASGSISGRNEVGGFVGLNLATISGTARTAASVSGVGEVGGFVGWNQAGASIDLTAPDGGAALGASGAVTATGDQSGGLVGVNYGAISGGTASGVVNGAGFVGGYVGWNATGGSITGGTAAGAVTASGGYAGGFAGWNSVATLSGGRASGGVSGVDYVGGLVGVNQGTVTDALVSGGAVSGRDQVGGLIGLNQGAVARSGAAAPTTGDLYVGGLVGYNDGAGTIDDAYATGATTGRSTATLDAAGDQVVGGLVGVNYGVIRNAYATGAVSGVNIVGGLVGANQAGGAVTSAYATGQVSASRAAVGGLFGVDTGTVTAVYWQPSTTGQTYASGYEANPAQNQPAPITGPPATFAYAGFDFTQHWTANGQSLPTLTQAPY